MATTVIEPEGRVDRVQIDGLVSEIDVLVLALHHFRKGHLWFTRISLLFLCIVGSYEDCEALS